MISNFSIEEIKVYTINRGSSPSKHVILTLTQRQWLYETNIFKVKPMLEWKWSPRSLMDATLNAEDFVSVANVTKEQIK